ncbi:hypothetical protein C8039_18335 [Halogeometricum sp. wsp3]|nr:hypothetical protein C8039_18335 [Halogeometricum sp. wsp3]
MRIASNAESRRDERGAGHEDDPKGRSEHRETVEEAVKQHLRRRTNATSNCRPTAALSGVSMSHRSSPASPVVRATGRSSLRCRNPRLAASP